MKYKIVADSACNIVSGEDGTFASVPMKIVAEREYVDDANLDVAQMVEDLKQYKGKSGSSCPNVGEWLEAFGDAEGGFGITISKGVEVRNPPESARPQDAAERVRRSLNAALPIRTWPSIRRERCLSLILSPQGRK